MIELIPSQLTTPHPTHTVDPNQTPDTDTPIPTHLSPYAQHVYISTKQRAPHGPVPHRGGEAGPPHPGLPASAAGVYVSGVYFVLGGADPSVLTHIKQPLQTCRPVPDRVAAAARGLHAGDAH